MYGNEIRGQLTCVLYFSQCENAKVRNMHQVTKCMSMALPPNSCDLPNMEKRATGMNTVDKLSTPWSNSSPKNQCFKLSNTSSKLGTMEIETWTRKFSKLSLSKQRQKTIIFKNKIFKLLHLQDNGYFVMGSYFCTIYEQMNNQTNSVDIHHFGSSFH